MLNQGTPTSNPLNTPLHASEAPQDFRLKSNDTGEFRDLDSVHTGTVGSAQRQDEQKGGHINLFSGL